MSIDQSINTLQPPPAPANPGNWFMRHKVATGVLAFVGVFSIAGAIGGGSSPETAAKAPASSTSTTAEAAQPAPAVKVQEPVAKEAPAVKAEPEVTVSQKNAVRAAENYLGFSAFSKLGLIRQLSSSAGDGYSKADATYAVNHIDVDWNAQAVKAAENYLEIMSFSRAGMIQQLTSSAGDQYTRAQATYAVDKLGL